MKRPKKESPTGALRAAFYGGCGEGQAEGSARRTRDTSSRPLAVFREPLVRAQNRCRRITGRASVLTKTLGVTTYRASRAR